jgi:hypothetical protein
MVNLGEQDFDRLALDSSEIIGFVSGSVVDYDVAGYDRCSRIEVDPGSLPTHDYEPDQVLATPPQAAFMDQSYLVRVAGFRRRNKFGPDQIGQTFREHGVAWSDGLGNGLYESLLICRKYGLGHVLEAPILGFPLPFLEPEFEGFSTKYDRYLETYIADLKIMQHIYGGEFTGDVLKLIVLWEKDYPLAHFIRAYQRSPQQIGAEIEKVIGMDELPIHPQTPVERAALMKFWNWVRLKQSRVVEVEAQILREKLGPNTNVIANPHELPVLDFDGQARAFDIPAVALRPLLLDDPLMLRHYVAYFTQLNHDLTGKAPMVSVRMNLSAATPTFVPTRRLIQHWYDQAVRHGAGSFYFWTRDYPTNNDPDTFDGPIPGNPIASTLPQERWDASLDILGHLSSHQRFLQPRAEVAILIPTDSALLHREEWRRIYTAFSALTQKRIFTNFISDRQIENDGVPENLRLLIAPVLEFLSDELHQNLEAFIRRQGRLIITNEEFYDRQGLPVDGLQDAQVLDSSIFDAFPVGLPGNIQTHERAEQLLMDSVLAVGIDLKSWVFDLYCSNLPETEYTWLREYDPDVYFAPWLYEHGSEWIMPYLKDFPNRS